MTTIDTQLLDSLGLTRTQEEQRSNDELGQSEFLELMVTQLNNQDPMKPMQSGEFYTQIAQFSTVAGIQDLQGSFQQVASAMYSNQALQASAMVGRSVMVNAGSAELAPEGGISGMIDVPSSTSRLEVSIYDQAGQRVRTLDLGERGAGEATFNWDGMTGDGEVARPGMYRIEAEMQAGGESVALDTQLSSRVDSVSMGRNGQGITLNVAGVGAVSLEDVKQVM
jgi:flagellar basal-body rod modification protein FlgD